MRLLRRWQYCTVGGDALQGGEQISPDKACFDAAVPLLHPRDVAHPQLLFALADYLRKGQHGSCGVQLLAAVGGERQLQ